MKHTTVSVILVMLLAISLSSVGWSIKKETDLTKVPKINQLTKSEIKKGWQLLFDGKSFNGWRGLGRDHVPAGTWIIENGVIKKVNTGDMRKLPDGRDIEKGDLTTISTFENFELQFEWKINKGGNSGLKYNVSEEMCQKYGSRYSALGFEYQLLDNGDERYKGKLKPSQYTGSLYDLLPSKNVSLKPAGEFNTSRIIVDGMYVEHWLNGKKVLEYELGSKELEDAYKISKFNKYVGYLDKLKAHIILQDHNDESWFRNIKIRELR